MASANRTRQDRKSYTFTMSSPDMVWTCVGAVFALTVFFLFGVLVGRGYLPTDADGAAPTEIGQQANAAAHGQLTGGDTVAPGEPALAEPEPEVLKAEELAYQDQLDKPAEVVETAADAEEVAQAATDAAKEAGDKAAAEAAEAVDDGKYDSSNLPAPKPGENIYHYTYQAAAFKDEPAAIGLAATLKERGLDAKVTKAVTTSATWYRVQIPFTGTPSQTNPLRDAIKSVTGQKPVMVSKKEK